MAGRRIDEKKLTDDDKSFIRENREEIIKEITHPESG